MVKNITKYTLRNTITTGFTLIELLVIIGIIAVTTSAGLFAYNRLSHEQAFSSNTKKIIDVINLTRKRALTGDVSRGCSGTLEYYEFRKSSPAVYTVVVKCSDSTESSVYTYTVAGQTMNSIESIVLFPGNTAVTGVRFSPMTGEVSADTSAGSVALHGSDYIELTVKNTALNSCIPITINSLGAIAEGSKQTCS